VGGPTEQKTNTVFIPPGEGRQTFAPSPLAWLVENLELGDEGVLESIVGPSILRIKSQIFAEGTDGTFEGRELSVEDSGMGTDQHITGSDLFGVKTGVPFSIFSTRLVNGTINVLLYRIGSRLYRFRGGRDQADEVLLSNLSVNPSSPKLDHYTVINDKIIYTNGNDHPKVISYDGSVIDLGFSRRASVPSVSCPSQPDYDEGSNYYPNSRGYSWQGRIGTPGDELAGQKASLLKGMWYYYFQYEDYHGNLSEFSVPSDPATIHTNQADPFFPVGTRKDGEAVNLVVGNEPRSSGGLPLGTEIDDLTRRFLVKAGGDLPSHAVATRIYRTKDTVHKDSTPRLLARVPGSKQFHYDDNQSDSDLGSEWRETVSVPTFSVCCSHQGRLIIGGIPGDSGIVRRSQPGFPGTFEKADYIYPDSTGAEVTALYSHNGALFAFTRNSTYFIGDDFSVPQPISTTVGCVSPKSIRSFRDGSLIWLTTDGFYSLRPDRTVMKLSDSIDKVVDQELNSSQFFRASAVIDEESGEYRCAVTAKGEHRNTIILCFDGTYWRRQTLGIQISDLCSSADGTKVTLAVGSDMRELDRLVAGATSPGSGVTESLTTDLSRVFVLNRQSTDYFAPPRRVRYRSAWLRSSELGLVPTNVRNLYIGLLDSWVGNATVRLYRNGSWNPVAEMTDLFLCGPDDDSMIVSDVASRAVIGVAKTRNPRLFWRQIPVDMQNANSWAFEIDLVGGVDPQVKRQADGTDITSSRLLGSLEDGTLRDRKILDRIFDNNSEAKDDYIRSVAANRDRWELGRLRIAAFAFDTSVATKGSPLGRVPKRQDK